MSVVGPAKALRSVAPYFTTALVCGTLLMVLGRQRPGLAPLGGEQRRRRR